VTEPTGARSDMTGAGLDNTPSGRLREPGPRRPPENDSGSVVTEAPQSEPLVGPVRPTGAVTEELTEIVQADETRLGEVYHGLCRNMTADQIAAELGVATSSFVWNYSQTLKALLEGDLPVKPTVALSAARKFRTLLKHRRLSPATRQYLQTNLMELERRANDTAARVAETEEAQEHTEKAEARNEVGIYAYALPHYLRYPFEQDTGRTLMKVGRSDSDVIQRPLSAGQGGCAGWRPVPPPGRDDGERQPPGGRHRTEKRPRRAGRSPG